MVEKRNACSGLTLLELLIVLAVLGLVLTVLPPLFGGDGGKSAARTAAHNLAAALRGTRSAAVAANRSAALKVDVARRALRHDGQPPWLAKEVELTLYTATAERSDALRGAIRFFADGTSTGGGVAVRSGDVRYDVMVDWLTGRVSIHDRGASSR